MDILRKEYCTRRGSALEAFQTRAKSRGRPVTSDRQPPRRCGQAAVILVEAPVNHCKSSTVAKEVMAIKYRNKTGHSIKKFLEALFAGKHPMLISKAFKAAAAEAAVTVAEAIAVADLAEAKRLAAEFEAMGGDALNVAIAQEAEAARSTARKS